MRILDEFETALNNYLDDANARRNNQNLRRSVENADEVVGSPYKDKEPSIEQEPSFKPDHKEDNKFRSKKRRSEKPPPSHNPNLPALPPSDKNRVSAKR